jgi:hypothetical protein
MNVAIMPNEPDLAKTPPTEPRPERHDAEAEYLAREIADSKSALIRTTEELKENLCATADLTKWVKQYPWAALGVATVTGFTVAAVVTPQPGQTFSDKLSSLLGKQPPDDDSVPGEAASAARSSKASSGARMSQSLLESLFSLARILLESFIVAAVRGPANQPPPTESRTDQTPVNLVDR